MPDHPEITWDATKPSMADDSWSEFILGEYRNGELRRRTPLTREGGERLIEALHDHLHPWAGRSIQEQIWQHLDAATDRLLNGGEAADDRGLAKGLALAISIFQNPYAPNIDAVRAEAMKRAGKERSVMASEDPQTVWLRERDMIALQKLASEIKIKGYQKLDKGRLIKALDEYDLDAWRQPAQPAEEPAADATEDEEDWDLTEG